MSGRCSGVQKKIKEVAPQAIYIHCYAHTLNLVLVDAVKSIQCASEFFALLEMLYVFLSSSKANAIYLEKQSKLYPHEQPMRLPRLSDTWWASRHLFVNMVCCRYDCLIATLEDIGNGSDATRSIESRGLHHQLKSFSFLLTLVTFDKVLSITKCLSDQLQSVNIDLGSAAQLVIASKAALQDYRSDEMWSKLYSYAVSIAEKHNIDINVADGHRRKRPQRQLDDCVIYESVGSREEVTTSQEFKQKLYFPVLDAFLAEIERRFDDKNIDIMKAIQACHPDSEAFLCINALQPLIENYALDKDAIE